MTRQPFGLSAAAVAAAGLLGLSTGIRAGRRSDRDLLGRHLPGRPARGLLRAVQAGDRHRAGRGRLERRRRRDPRQGRGRRPGLGRGPGRGRGAGARLRGGPVRADRLGRRSAARTSSSTPRSTTAASAPSSGRPLLAYDGDKITDGPPQSWADFWDTEKFPGKRGLRRGPKYTLEFALMADGVPPAEVYQTCCAPRKASTAPSRSSTRSRTTSSGGRRAPSRRSCWPRARWS